MRTRTIHHALLCCAVLIAGIPACTAQYNTSSLSFMQRNFFHSVGGSFAGVYATTPATLITPSESSGGSPYYRKREYFGVFNFNYEPRVNVYNVRDYFSLSVALPVGISLGDNAENFGLAARAGAFAQANFFYHATYNNIDMRGFYLGWGPYRIMNFTAPEDGGPQAWTHWTFRGGMKRQGKRLGWQYGLMYSGGRWVTDADGDRVRELGLFQYEIAIILGYGK